MQQQSSIKGLDGKYTEMLPFRHKYTRMQICLVAPLHGRQLACQLASSHIHHLLCALCPSPPSASFLWKSVAIIRLILWLYRHSPVQLSFLRNYLPCRVKPSVFNQFTAATTTAAKSLHSPPLFVGNLLFVCVLVWVGLKLVYAPRKEGDRTWSLLVGCSF